MEERLCQCGCGQKTSIAKRIDSRRKWEKGKPVNFIRGHHCRGKNHPMWKGGKVIDSQMRSMTRLPDHPRANTTGYVFDHILQAEKALGKPLLEKHPVHHFPNREKPIHLIICEDKSYHEILHSRYKAFKVCGHAHWRKCWICKTYDDPQNMYTNPADNKAHHRECRNKNRRERANWTHLTATR